MEERITDSAAREAREEAEEKKWREGLLKGHTVTLYAWRRKPPLSDAKVTHATPTRFTVEWGYTYTRETGQEYGKAYYDAPVPICPHGALARRREASWAAAQEEARLAAHAKQLIERVTRHVRRLSLPDLESLEAELGQREGESHE